MPVVLEQCSPGVCLWEPVPAKLPRKVVFRVSPRFDVVWEILTNGAFAWLYRSLDSRERYDFENPLTYLVFDEVWDALRHEQRFQALLDKTGFTRVNPHLRDAYRATAR